MDQQKNLTLQDHLRRYSHRLSIAVGLSRKANLPRQEKNLESIAEASEKIGDMVMLLDVLDSGSPEEKMLHIQSTLFPVADKAMRQAYDAIREVGATAHNAFHLTSNEAALAVCNIADVLEGIEQPTQKALTDELCAANQGMQSPDQIMNKQLCVAIDSLDEIIDRDGLKPLSKEQHAAVRNFKKPLKLISESLLEASNWIEMGQKKGQASAFFMGAIDTYGEAKSAMDHFLAKHEPLRQRLASRLEKDTGAYHQSSQGQYDKVILDTLNDTAVVFQTLDQHMTRAAATLRHETPARAPRLAFAC